MMIMSLCSSADLVSSLADPVSVLGLLAVFSTLRATTVLIALRGCVGPQRGVCSLAESDAD